ncbi:LysR family transcriptional regulator [Roseomonas chloroacetimidivorans]|uniref:LysR family transcriptional regulator n=1 Tax=Roseomonas chloroacetimidivorans TaxID=1766656 RepID=UPI003C79662A
MNLRTVDLNLLVIFDALMAERHVSRAAARIGMSQPAVSNALSRLRHLFQDELFIRAAGRMEPTPRALELGQSVEVILRQAERLLVTDLTFDPRASDRHFTLRMSDLVGYLALPRITAHLRDAAPAVSLEVLHTSPEDTLKALEADTLDLALSMALDTSRLIRSAPLFQDRMCCVMSASHPLAKGRLSLERFLGHPHMRVAMSPTDTRFVDNVLVEQGLQRRVVLTVPHWLLVPRTLAGTDLLAVVSRKMADLFTGDGGIVARPLPFQSVPFDWHLYWHRRYDGSAAHLWLRETITALCRTI